MRLPENPAVFQHLFEVLYRYSRGRGLGHEDAQDVAQEVLARESTFAEYDPDRGSLENWLIGAASFRVRNFIHRSRRRLPLQSDEAREEGAADPRFSTGEFLECLEKAISSLSASERKVFEELLRETLSAELPEKPAADGGSLKREDAAWRTRLSRARKKLRELMAEYDPDLLP